MKTYFTTLLIFLLGLLQLNVLAQNGLLSPNGVSFPVYSNALRPAANSVGIGTVLYNSSQNTHQYSNGSSWLNLQGAGVLPSGTDNQTLRYSGGSWVADDNLKNNGSSVWIGNNSPFTNTSLSIKSVSNTTGIRVDAQSGVGTLSYSISNVGVHGSSLNGYGVVAYSENSIGLYASGNPYSADLKGRIQISNDTYVNLDPGMELIKDFYQRGFVGLNGANEVMVFGYGLNAAIQRWNVNTGAICYATTPTVCSDIRLKKDFAPIANSLTKLSMLQGYNYHWKNEKMIGLQTGFIAQEVQRIFPELVKTDEKGYLSVDYVGLVPHLVEANKLLKKQNEEMLERIEALERRFSSQFEASNSTKNTEK